MIFVLSGEGPTDLGCCNNGAAICNDGEFSPGPMTILIDQLIETEYQFSPLATCPNVYFFVGKKELINRAKNQRGHRSMVLTGPKHGKETGYYHINAWMLGQMARELEAKHDSPSVAVLFRDADGTHSTPAAWEAKWDSMLSGFDRAMHTRGVPMLAKPKSEAWLLCAAKDNPYQHCAALENLPGNDDSPASAKMQLDDALEGRSSRSEVCDWLSESGFDHEATGEQMPSYGIFVARFFEALATQ